MATKKEEFLQSVKARIDEINPGLYEKLEASSADTARSNGIAESDRASFITSETLLHSAQALLGYEITLQCEKETASGIEPLLSLCAFPKVIHSHLMYNLYPSNHYSTCILIQKEYHNVISSFLLTNIIRYIH